MERAYNILVAEDEEYNYTLIKYIFEKEGHTVIWARNGEEAVETVKRRKDINLVLMDIKMPILNGLDATRMIKEYNRDMPVLAVTAYAMAEDREICLEAGCDDFMTKPIIRSKLLNTSYKLIQKG